MFKRVPLPSARPIGVLQFWHAATAFVALAIAVGAPATDALTDAVAAPRAVEGVT